MTAKVCFGLSSIRNFNPATPSKIKRIKIMPNRNPFAFLVIANKLFLKFRNVFFGFWVLNVEHQDDKLQNHQHI